MRLHLVLSTLALAGAGSLARPHPVSDDVALPAREVGSRARMVISSVGRDITIKVSRPQLPLDSR